MVGQALSVLAGLLVAAGVGLAVVGLLGWRRRLPRNRVAGVRTVSSLRDQETFAVANQVGAPLTIAAGAVAVLGGLAALAAPPPAGGGLAARVTLVALATLGALALTITGGVLGDQAAKRVPVRRSGGCAGACASCGCAPMCGAEAADARGDSEPTPTER